MASLLNNASLLLNPAGSIISYQEDKIYSVLPKDGTGDFTFSGGDGGTRVNQQGYIEVTPANLAFQSNAFSTSPWGRQNTTLTSGQSDPLGGTNAWKVEFSAAQAYLYQYTAPITGVVTISAYLRADSTTTIGFNDGAGNPNSVTIGTTWKLYTFTYTVSSAYYIIQFDNYFGVSPASQAKTFYVYGAQLNIGSTARPYQPTTDRLNYPRITYQNGRGALLSEPQRTNLFIQSQNFATYGVYRFTQTLNAVISPDGTQNASKIVETATAGTHQYEPSFSATSGQAYTVSVFAKAAERTQLHIFAFADNGVFNSTDAFYDLAAGTVISGTGASIEKWPNGWYRCIRTMTAGATGTGYWGIGIAVNGVASYTGDSSSGIYMWGGQNEAGEFASTYIPTTSATVTRPLDQFFNNDSPALNTTSWTFYMSGVNIGKNQNSSGNPIDAVNWSFDSGGGPYGPNSIHNYNNTVYYYDTVNGAANLGSIGNTTTKFAVTKNGTTFKLFRDGVLFSTNTLSLASNVWDSFRMYGDVDAQGQAYSNNPSTVAILPSALSDADAQSITTVRSGSGGNISYYGPYTIHTFTGSATLTPSFNGQVEVLVVAGGGGTGYDVGGGGGGGGIIYASSYGVTAGSGVTVTIGAGGTSGQTVSTAGGNGGNSVFGGLTALGGGGGGTYPSGQVNGLDGGSGGGAGNQSAIGGSGSIGQGYNGGSSSAPWGSGGGGGAGGNGANAIQSQTVPGGLGATYSISGFSTTYSGGGYGAYDSQTDLPTGQSASGAFLGYYGYGANGTGLPNNSPYTGNPGIVIIRYLT